MRLWEVSTGKELRLYTKKKGRINRIIVNSVAFSPDGRFALSGGEDPFNFDTKLRGSLILWDVATGQQVRELDGEFDKVLSVAFSPDGRFILAGSEKFSDDRDKPLKLRATGYLKLWEVATSKELRSFSGHARSVAISPDSRLALSGSDDGSVKLWDIATGEEIRTFREDADTHITSVAFSPDGHFALASGSDSTLQAWEIASSNEPLNFQQHPASTHSGDKSAVFSRDGRFVLSGGPSGLFVWDAATGREIRNLTGHGNAIREVAFSSDGRLVLYRDRKDDIAFWSTSTGRRLSRFSAHEKKIISPGSHMVLSIDMDKELRRLNTRQSYLSVFALSSDSRFSLSGRDDGTVELRDSETGQVLRNFSVRAGGIRLVAFSPDDRFVLAYGGNGEANELMVWHKHDGAELAHVNVRLSPFTSPTFSPDSQFIAYNELGTIESIRSCIRRGPQLR